MSASNVHSEQQLGHCAKSKPELDGWRQMLPELPITRGFGFTDMYVMLCMLCLNT